MKDPAVDVDLVPAQRLGRVLRDARVGSGLDHADVAMRAGGRVTAAVLAAAEDGDLRLAPGDLQSVAAALDIELGELVPARAELVIDLEEGTISAGDRTRRPAGSGPDEILTQYLALVYTLRGVEPGSPIPLRDVDVEVLSQALQMESAVLERRLAALMVEPPTIVSERSRQLRRRIIVPAAGILVGVTAVGALVFVLGDDSTSPVPDIGSNVGQAVVVQSEVELAPPLVAERGPDGQVTVRERTGDTTGAAPAVGPRVELIPPLVVERGSDTATVPSADVELIPPLVVERGADGGEPPDFD